MKLYEEFKKYENLWEELSPADEADELLSEMEDIELEYDGFEGDWYKDHFDPRLPDGHYQTYGTLHYPSFYFPVDPGEMSETISDIMFPNYVAKHMDSPVIKEWVQKKEILEELWATEQHDLYDKLSDELYLFEVINLNLLVDVFYEELLKHYEEEAYDWARANISPYDENDY